MLVAFHFRFPIAGCRFQISPARCMAGKNRQSKILNHLSHQGKDEKANYLPSTRAQPPQDTEGAARAGILKRSEGSGLPCSLDNNEPARSGIPRNDGAGQVYFTVGYSLFCREAPPS
jgi:hypothetical protein